MTDDHFDLPSVNTGHITSFQLETNYLYNRLIRDTEGAALLGCSKATFWRRVADGTLPPAIKIGGMSRWKLLEILHLIEDLRAEQLRERHSVKPSPDKKTDQKLTEQPHEAGSKPTAAQKSTKSHRVQRSSSKGKSNA